MSDFLAQVFGLTIEEDIERDATDTTEHQIFTHFSLCPPPDRYDLWDEEEMADVTESQSETKWLPVTSNRFKLLLHSQNPKWASGSLRSLPQFSTTKKS